MYVYRHGGCDNYAETRLVADFHFLVWNFRKSRVMSNWSSVKMIEYQTGTTTSHYFWSPTCKRKLKCTSVSASVWSASEDLGEDDWVGGKRQQFLETISDPQTIRYIPIPMTITITITMTITSNEYHSPKTKVKLTTTVTTLLDCSDYNVVTTVQLKSIVWLQQSS